MKVCAFVFARGGSKGLPGKNTMELGGIPLVGHSIRTAKSTPSVTHIFVSTDSDEVANVATKFGAQVIMRPAELSSDTAAEWDAWRHAIDHVKDLGIEFDVFLSLPATSPLRNARDVQACLDALDMETDVVVTVTPSSQNPYFNMVTRDRAGLTQILMPSSGFFRRQDAPPVFDLTAVAYVTRPDFIRTKSNLFSGTVRSVIVPKERAVDIDDEWDFRFAECLNLEKLQ